MPLDFSGGFVEGAAVDEDEGRRRIAAYFQAAFERSGEKPTAFARAWGTNEKTLEKILDGVDVRSDARRRIVEARGWPPNAFELIRIGRDPEHPEQPAPDEMAEIRTRLDRIEAHLGLGETPSNVRRLPAHEDPAEFPAAAEGDQSKRGAGRSPKPKPRPRPKAEQ